MSETKQFDLSDVLSITTERLVSSRHMEGVYDILNWMTDDNLFTHQLPRASRECKPWLLRWFPELLAINESIPQLQRMIDERGGDVGCPLWVANLIAVGAAKAVYDVPRIPRDDHEQIDFYDELVQMRGTDEGILLVKADDEETT